MKSVEYITTKFPSSKNNIEMARNIWKKFAYRELTGPVQLRLKKGSTAENRDLKSKQTVCHIRGKVFWDLN